MIYDQKALREELHDYLSKNLSLSISVEEYYTGEGYKNRVEVKLDLTDPTGETAPISCETFYV